MSSVNHVGVTVPDIRRAVDWYTEVLGLRLVSGPTRVTEQSPAKARRDDVFGPRWGGMTVAHLIGDNGTGLELFEFEAPVVQRPADNFEYWRVGVFHFALTVDDVESVGKRIDQSGGRQRTAVHELHGSCVISYCEDPWGTIIELSSEPYDYLASSHGRAMTGPTARALSASEDR